MDCLSKEQLLLLQHNLTYENYEKFMDMFEKDEQIPTETIFRKLYILEVMKNHEFWGEIYGWGDKRVYKRIPKSPDDLTNYNGPYEIFSIFKAQSKKELVEFLNTFKDVINITDTFNPEYCMPIEEFKQVPMTSRWMNDSVY